MQRAWMGVAGVAMSAAMMGGCQSMAVAMAKRVDQKPYVYPMAARQLAPMPMAPALVVPEAAPAVAAAPAEPVRTDVRGAGDGSMKVDRVIVTAGAEKVKHDVADFSREQVANMVCRTSRNNAGDKQGEANARVVKAWRATVAAHEARAALEAGTGSRKAADAAEEERQKLVKPLMGSSFVFDLFGGLEKKNDLPKPEQDGVALEQVDLFTFTENGLEVMAVSGVARNTTNARADVSPVTLQALDRWEFILTGQTTLLPFAALEAGEAKPFEVRFLNPPDTTAEVYAHFAPPFEYRARRDCEDFDPAQVDVSPSARFTPEPIETATTGMHTAAELNALARVYRSEAEAAWMCRKGAASEPPKGGLQFDAEGSGERREGFSISLSMGKPNMERVCAPAARRLPWREAYELAEATDEAWGAMRAAQETQRRAGGGQGTQAEADVAAQAQAASYRRFRDLGARALERAGGTAPDVAVEVGRSEYGYVQLQGFYVEVKGTLRNTGAETRTVDHLMLALVDRLEQPLLSIRLDEAAELKPGETKDFTHRAWLREPVRRASPEETPMWQVRIGAMGR